jgi:HJR/Mrr/RecB family endonuclease
MPAEPATPAVLEPAAAQEAPVEVAPPPAEPAPKQKPKKEKKPRSNPLGAIVVQAKLIQQRREEQRQAERAQIIYAIRRMNDEAYETMLLDFFRRDGYTVYRVDDPASSEADLELHRNNERTLVGIKRRGHQVGQESVRELDKEIATSGANSAFLFTDASFTEAAVRVANNSGVTLVDGNMLAELIEELTMSELRERKATSRLAKAVGWGKKAS